jgi:ABC-type lipoprotein release transport system permease subunit
MIFYVRNNDLSTVSEAVMILFFACAAGVAVLATVFAVAVGFALHRPTAVTALQPRPETYRNIRVLHNDDEIRDVARRAYERERLIAYEADRRGAHFRQLTSSQPRFTTVRAVASDTQGDHEFAAGDS